MASRELGEIGRWGKVGLLGVFLVVSVPVWADWHPEKKVRQPTRLDWEFAAGPRAPLPIHYDARRQQYQCFEPDGYRATRAWPLLLVLPEGDDAGGVQVWQQACATRGCFCVLPHGIGSRVPVGQRVRALLDVFDDVRQLYRIDPDRVYLCGVGRSTGLAAQIAFALPDHFAGVIALAGEVPLPRAGYLRKRAAARLRVALSAEPASTWQERQERFQVPVLLAAGVSAKFWAAPQEEGLPPALTLIALLDWLEEEVKQRQADRRALGPMGDEAPTRRHLASAALDQARKLLEKPEGLYPAFQLLEWTVSRCGLAPGAVDAAELLDKLGQDEAKLKQIETRRRTEEQEIQTAQVRSLERTGQLREALQGWRKLGQPEEVARVQKLLRTTPWIGLHLARETNLIRDVASAGPADQAGLQIGDLVVQIGKVKVTGAQQLRRELSRTKPGDALELTVQRGEKNLTVKVEVRATPG